MSPLATTGLGGRSNFAIELDLRTTTQLAKMGSRIASSFFANRRGSLRDYSFLSSIAPQQRRCHAAVKGARGKSRSNGRRLRRCRERCLPSELISRVVCFYVRQVVRLGTVGYVIAAATLGCSNVEGLRSACSGGAVSCDETDGGRQAIVPIEFVNDLAIVEVTAEGAHGPLRLLLDSGSPTTIRADILHDVQFRNDDSWGADLRALDAYGGSLEIETILIKRLSIGALSFSDLPAAVLDTRLFDLFCPPIDGVLGHGGSSASPGFLERVSIEIDRNTDRLRVSRAIGESKDRPPEFEIPIEVVEPVGAAGRSQSSTPQAAVVIGDLTFRGKIDTGGSGLSEMSRDVFDQIGRAMGSLKAREYVGFSSISMSGVASMQTSWIVILPSINIGDLEIRSVPFRIRTNEELQGTELRIAQNILRGFNVSIDFSGRRMGLSRRIGWDANPFLEPQVEWAIVGDRMVAVGILRDGVAAAAGVQLWDELISVNDEEIDTADPESLCDFRFPSSEDRDREEELRLRRGSEEIRVVLPAREAL